VAAAELRRRLPSATVTAFSPLGRLRPMALDGGRPAEPLGPPSAGRRQELAARFDCVLVCGEDSLVGSARAAALWGDEDGGGAAAARLLVDGLGAELEAGCPVVWAGVSVPEEPDPDTAARVCAVAACRGPIAVLDGGSRRRLAAAGVTADISVLPPVALLLPRLLDREMLRRRADLLRMMEWTWAGGAVLTIHGDRSLMAALDAVAAAVLPLVESGIASVQLGASGRLDGEEDFADALEAALGGRCRRLPGVAALEDHVAALAGSRAFAGPPGFGLCAATGLGLPAASLTLSEDDGDDGLAAELGAARLRVPDLAAGLRGLLSAGAPRPEAATSAAGRLDHHFDTVADLALVAAARRAAGRRGEQSAGIAPEALLEALGRAHAARGRRLFQERAAFDAARQAAVGELSAQLEQAHADADRLRAELAAARAANDRMVASRTWRYTQPVRDALARVRERRR
jgi:hypothetical protein